MANPMSAQWPTSWPKYLPFPRSIPRSRGPVPNASSVNWPQSQWASLYLNPGSPSFQPYSYFKNSVPLTSIEPVYTADVPAALGPLSQNLYRGGPGGDIARLPLGGLMLHNPSSRVAQYRKQARLEKRALRAEASRRRRSYRARAKQLEAAALAAEAQTPQVHTFQPVVRMGARPSNIQIPTGVPDFGEAPALEPIATAGLTPLYGSLALENGQCASCYGDTFFQKGDGGFKWVNIAGTAAAVAVAYKFVWPMVTGKKRRQRSSYMYI